MVDIEVVKGYMKVDDDDDDSLIEVFIKTAEKVVIKGTKKDIDTSDERFILAVMMITDYWYENRGAVAPNASNTPLGVLSLMTQLAVS